MCKYIYSCIYLFRHAGTNKYCTQVPSNECTYIITQHEYSRVSLCIYDLCLTMLDYLYFSYDACVREEYDLPRLKEISVQILIQNEIIHLNEKELQFKDYRISMFKGSNYSVKEDLP